MRHYRGLRTWTLAGAFALAGILSLGGCATSPQAKEAKALARGKLLIEQKDYARAMLEFKSAAGAVKTDAEPYFQMALIALERDDTQAAYQLLTKAIQLNPQYVEAKSRLARLIAEKGSARLLPEAEKTAKDVAAVAPDNVDALDTLALVELRSGSRGGAESYLDEALGKFPESLLSSVVLAKVKLLANDQKGAEEVLKAAVQHSPKSADAWLALGNFYVVIGRSSDAFQAFESALHIQPQYPLTLVSLAEAQHRSGQRDKAEETLRQLSMLPDPRYESLYGAYLFDTGKREAALREFERLAAKHPTDRGARGSLVDTYLALNRIGDAENVVNRALKQNSKDSDALLDRSHLHLLQRNYTAAQNDLNQVLEYQPRSAEAHFLLSRIDKVRGFSPSERQELNEALQINPDLLAARLALAQNLIFQSPKDALELLDKAPKRQIGELSFIVARNSCLLALGRNAEVRKSLDQALASARTPELLVQDGLIWLRQQQYEKSRASLREAVEKRPKDPKTLDLLARTYVAQKQPGKALDVIREHASKHPEAARIQQLLGGWLQGNGKLLEARAAFTAAKTADPALTQADIALALMDMRAEDFNAARKRLTAVLAAAPADTRARFLLASVEDYAQDYPAAIAQYRQLIVAEPDNVLFLNNISFDLAEYARQPDEALKYAQKAKELAPTDPRVADTLGWVFYQKGVYRSAVGQLEAAASAKGVLADQELGRAQYHLAMAYFKSGNPTQGRQVLETARRLAPTLPESKMAQAIEQESVRP